jgi:hypothetical protein
MCTKQINTLESVLIMPITRAEFERGRVSESLAHQIRTFLERNDGYAFTWDELYAQCFPNQKKKWAHVVMGVVALSQLTTSKIIESRLIDDKGEEDGTVYYSVAARDRPYT